MTRRASEIVVLPSVSGSVEEVLYALSVADGTMWRLAAPWKNKVWQRIPDLPGDRQPSHIAVLPSVSGVVDEVLYALSVEGTMWRMEDPGNNKTWQPIPDLPGDDEPASQEQLHTIPFDHFDRRSEPAPRLSSKC